MSLQPGTLKWIVLREAVQCTSVTIIMVLTFVWPVVTILAGCIVWGALVLLKDHQP